MTAHAILSASSSHRWMNCPPSARLAEQFPDTGGAYAAAGTLAHAIAELKVRKYFLEPMSAKDFQASMKALKNDPCYERAMDENTDLYLEHLKSLAMSYGDRAPFVAAEVRVDYSRWAPGGFGTADCILIGGDRLCIADYKNGAGVAVEAVENCQLKLYALGALETYRPIFGDTIRDIHLSIVQPNAGGIKTWETTAEALTGWAEEALKPAAALAWEGKGEFNPGPWCDSGFCPAKARCAARAKKLLEIEPLQNGTPAGAAKDGESAALLTDEEVGDILQRSRQLAAFVKALEEYALSAMLKGAAIPGFKVVSGRSSRSWAGGADKAFAALKERGVAEELLYERKPVTAPALEKTLGKKAFKELTDGLVETTPGAPTLAPASDKRKPYNPAEAAFKPVEPAIEF